MFLHLRIRYQRLRFFPNPSFRPTVESHLLMSGASVAADPGHTRTPTTGTAVHCRSPASVDHRHASWCFPTLQLTVVLVLELGKQAVRNNLSMSDFQPPVPTLTPSRVRRVKGQERKTPKSYDMRLSPDRGDAERFVWTGWEKSINIQVAAKASLSTADHTRVPGSLVWLCHGRPLQANSENVKKLSQRLNSADWKVK